MESVVRSLMSAKWKVCVCSLFLCFSVYSVYHHQFPSSFICTNSIFESVSFLCEMVHRSGQSERMMRCLRHMSCFSFMCIALSWGVRTCISWVFDLCCLFFHFSAIFNSPHDVQFAHICDISPNHSCLCVFFSCLDPCFCPGFFDDPVAVAVVVSSSANMLMLCDWFCRNCDTIPSTAGRSTLISLALGRF